MSKVEHLDLVCSVKRELSLFQGLAHLGLREEDIQ